MSSNKPVPETLSSSLQDASPDYVGLVRFLVEPFLESPQRLSVDCERSNAKERVWIRLAFEGADKGRVFGRGGRNIQAIRTVIQAAAQAAGQSVIWISTIAPVENPVERVALGIAPVQKEIHLDGHRHLNPLPNSALSSTQTVLKM
jgi:predicted RNA-binding protein YlqC (UPF0109 family)